jgi:hypothetical protein
MDIASTIAYAPALAAGLLLATHLLRRLGSDTLLARLLSEDVGAPNYVRRWLRPWIPLMLAGGAFVIAWLSGALQLAEAAASSLAAAVTAIAGHDAGQAVLALLRALRGTAPPSAAPGNVDPGPPPTTLPRRGHARRMAVADRVMIALGGFAIIAAAPGCDPFDTSPDFYVQALKPDLYYAWELPSGARATNIFFATTKPAYPALPPEVMVVTWAWPGGNIYDDSLAETTLKPTEREKTLLFSGSVAFPAAGYAEAIGVELRTFLYNVAYQAPSHVGQYCDVDVMGPGILDCGPWINAIVSLWVQCHGIVGQLIPCQELGFVLVPKIHTIGVQTEGPMADENPKEYLFLDMPELFMYARPDGWWYRAPDRSRKGSAIMQGGYGPFATAEDAARDAASRWDLSEGNWDDLLEIVGAESELGRAAAVLRSR